MVCRFKQMIVPVVTRGAPTKKPRAMGFAQGFLAASTREADAMWWSWGDLNPRPQAFFAQFYMFSDLI